MRNIKHNFFINLMVTKLIRQKTVKLPELMYCACISQLIIYVNSLNRQCAQKVHKKWCHKANIHCMLYTSDSHTGVHVPQGYKPRHLGVCKKNWIMAEKVHYLAIYSYNIQIWNTSNYINYKHFTNMKGTIYGNRLPRSMQV